MIHKSPDLVWITQTLAAKLRALFCACSGVLQAGLRACSSLPHRARAPKPLASSPPGWNCLRSGTGPPPWPPPAGCTPTASATTASAEEIKDTAVAQPLLVAAGIAAAEVLFGDIDQANTQVDILIVHSVGE